MSKNILLKSKDGVEVSFALTQITLKGETTIKFPSGGSWSDGAAKTYVYGEGYIDKIPDEMLAQIASLLMPAPEVEETVEEPETETVEEGSGDSESSSEGESQGSGEAQEGGAE